MTRNANDVWISFWVAKLPTPHPQTPQGAAHTVQTFHTSFPIFHHATSFPSPFTLPSFPSSALFPSTTSMSTTNYPYTPTSSSSSFLFDDDPSDPTPHSPVAPSQISNGTFLWVMLFLTLANAIFTMGR